MKKSRQIFTKLSLFIFAVCGTFLLRSTDAQAATKTQIESFKNEVRDMLYTADLSYHTVTKYNLSYDEYHNAISELRSGDCRMIYFAYDQGMYISSTTQYDRSGLRVKGVQIMNGDSSAPETYEAIQSTVNEIFNGMDASMSDVDKVIYLHDALVERVRYKNTGSPRIFGVNGALADRVAVCQGYAYALNFLLHQAGIETYYAREASLNHGWTYVKLDNEWYHIDATWDDTRSKIAGETSHTYLLKNDSQFHGAHGAKTWEICDRISLPATTVKGITSTSERFRNWWVHSIVGKMIYDGGMWYYVDNKTNSLMRATSDGAIMETLVDGSLGTIKLVSVENGTATYTLNQINMQWNSKISELPTVVAPVETTTQKPVDKASSTPAKEDKTVSEDKVVAEDEKASNVIYDLSNFSLWRTGMYDLQTGAYKKYACRICLNDYIPCDSNATYKAIISVEKYHVLIREMDASYKLITTHDLTNGTEFTTSSNCAYFGVNIYTPVNEWSNTYKTYTALFGKGISIAISGNSVTNVDPGEQEQAAADEVINIISPEDTNAAIPTDTTDMTADNATDDANIETDDSTSTPTATDNSAIVTDAKNDDIPAGTTDVIVDTKTEVVSDAVTTYFWNDIQYWRKGMYDLQAAKFTASWSCRICLNDYISCTGNTTLQAAISNNKYHILIRELDDTKKMIKSHDLNNGDTFTTSENCCYLAVSVYTPKNEWSNTFSTYKELFSQGMIVGLIGK